MKQFKAEWQRREGFTDLENTRVSVAHLMDKHNALCDYLAEREAQPTYTTSGLAQSEPIVIKQTITIPKPEFWSGPIDNRYVKQQTYLQALEDASKASGILFTIE